MNNKKAERIQQLVKEINAEIKKIHNKEVRAKAIRVLSEIMQMGNE